jgi:hypothetical protein
MLMFYLIRYVRFLYGAQHAGNFEYTSSIITSHILFGLGASLSLVNYAR